MKRPVRVHPIFYARLHLALINFDDSVEAEVEFVSRHLADTETLFSEDWDRLPGPPNDRRIRWATGAFATVPALFAVEGRLTESGVIELRNIRLIVDPLA